MSEIKDPQPGDVAIHTYKYKGEVYSEYVMYRRVPNNLSVWEWLNWQSDIVHADDVQPLPNASVLHAQLELPDPFAYVPKNGDVATIRCGSRVDTLFYRVVGGNAGSWQNQFGHTIRMPQDNSTFQLVLRDGILQERASD